jgi:hypothetical protein
VRRAQYREVEPSYYQESVPAGPIDEGAVGESWDHGPAFHYEEGGYCDDCYGDCYGDCCGGCGGYCGGPPPGFWGRAEYLYWWVRGSSTPPLVTTSPDGTPQADAGVLPDATVLFGGERLNTSGRSGGRFTLGYWFNSCQYMGVDTSFLFLGEVQQEYFNSSNGSPILARPFFNVLNGEQDANLIAFPNVIVGSIGVVSTSKVYGSEINLRRALVVDCWKRFDVMAGYRFFQLAENLTVNSNTTSIDPNGQVPVGTTFAIFDSFSTRNNFNGGQLGLNLQCTNGCWTLDFATKLAIGAVAQRVVVDGGTVTTVPNVQPVTNRGGILALDSNIGRFHRNQFAVLPEFAVDLRYQLTPLWRLNLGYTLLIATNVVRPGDQIDLSVDPNLFPPSLGGTQPKFAFHDSDVWLQGINFGIECNF